MIKLTNLILENNLREYSDEEKQKMGIPSGATSRGGVWYVGDKYAGKVVGGKFVAAAKTQPAGTGEKPSKDKTKTKVASDAPSTPEERPFNPSIPRAKSSPEYEAVKKLHAEPDMKKLRNTRLFGASGRPIVKATKDEYSMSWTAGGYGEPLFTNTVTFSTKNPSKFKVVTTVVTTPSEEDDTAFPSEEIFNQTLVGKGSVADAIKKLDKLNKKAEKDIFSRPAGNYDNPSSPDYLG